MTTKISLQQETCTRCGGTGTYPSSLYHGKCLGCFGSGLKLTAKGRAAQRKMLAWQEQHMQARVDELREGDRFYATTMSGAKYVETVQSIDQETGSTQRSTIDGETVEVKLWRVECRKVDMLAAPSHMVTRVWTADALRSCYREALARMSGAELIDTEEKK